MKATNRLRLIPLTQPQLSELAASGALVTTLPEINLAPGMTDAPTINAAKIKLEKMKTLDAAEYNWQTYWLIYHLADQVAIGTIGFKSVPDIKGRVEVGYGLVAEYQNRGLMTEALEAMLTWAFEQPGCKYVCAKTHKTNPASIQVLEKNGFSVYYETTMEISWRLQKEIFYLHHTKALTLCQFCLHNDTTILLHNNTWLFISDWRSPNIDSWLLFPKKHRRSVAELDSEEWDALQQIIIQIQAYLSANKQLEKLQFNWVLSMQCSATAHIYVEIKAQ